MIASLSFLVCQKGLIHKGYKSKSKDDLIDLTIRSFELYGGKRAFKYFIKEFDITKDNVAAIIAQLANCIPLLLLYEFIVYIAIFISTFLPIQTILYVVQYSTVHTVIIDIYHFYAALLVSLDIIGLSVLYTFLLLTADSVSLLFLCNVFFVFLHSVSLLCLFVRYF